MTQGERVVLGVSDVLTGNSFLKEFIPELTRRGFDALWFAGGEREPVSDLKPTFVRTASLKRTISITDDVAALRAIAALLRENKPAVAHFSTPKAALLGILAAAWRRVPRRVYLVRGLRLETATGPSWLLLWCLERLTTFFATDVLCVSFSLRDEAERLRLVGRGKAKVIGQGSSCGVDTQRFAPTAERRECALVERRRMGIGDDCLVFGYVGRLNKAKGVEEMLAAFAQLRDGHDVALICLGDLDPGEPISAQAEKMLRGGKGVHWLAYAVDPVPVYDMIDVLILATYREGFPNVVLEASSAGLAVITTTATGAIDSVVEGVTGLKVPVGDVDALASAMTRLIEHPDERRAMGLAGLARCRQYFERTDVVRLHVDHLVGKASRP